MRVLQLCFCLLVLILAVAAQNASLRGTVTDENGAVIPDAKIKLVSKDGKTYSMRSGSDGTYGVEVTSGKYTVNVAQRCFADYISGDFFIFEKRSVTLGVALKSSNDCELIEDYPSEPPPIETNKTGVNESVKVIGRPLEQLPTKQLKVNKRKKKTKQ